MELHPSRYVLVSSLSLLFLRVCILLLTLILSIYIKQIASTCTNNWNASVDQLNGALSGALAATIPHEINDYLVPQIQTKNIPTTAFKYLNFQIGSNDVCKYCTKADGSSGVGSAGDFEENIRTALEAIRTKIRKIKFLVLSNHYLLQYSSSMSTTFFIANNFHTLQYTSGRADIDIVLIP